MADSITFTVPNMADWMAELMQLPEVMQRRVVRGAVATGCSVIRNEVIQRAPVWLGGDSELQGLLGGKRTSMAANHPPPGTLKRAVYQTRLMGECTPTLEQWMVGVRSGKANKADAYYAKWVEYGHYTRTPRSLPGTRAQRRAAARASGAARWIPASPFFRPAFDSKQQAALAAMQDYINQNLPLAAGAFRYIKAIS